MAKVAPEAGDVIEDYEILEKIGGNMGLVFKARHRLLDKVLALKLLPIDDPARVARFEREIRVMGHLEHPNLVTATDARSVDSWLFVTMEWIDGVDLHQLVRTEGPLPVAVACEAVRQAALGLEYAHQHGLIHRDIKPSNLMLTRSGTIKVIDMGLALTQDDSTTQLTQTGHMLGTMIYCAPEQVLNASGVDIRADIYSLGCTLYHLLAGKAPCGPFPSLTEARPDAPAGLETVLAHMTAKDPASRFPTPSEVAAALEPFARGADLKRLVPPKTQPDPTAPVTPGKAPPAPRHTPGGSKEQPKARWTRRAALLVLPLSFAGGVVLFMNRDPIVVLMDTTADGGVYDDDNKGNGGSNASELYKVLGLPDGPLPSRSLHQEPISKGWAREDYVRSLRPHLVIIHRSAFFHTVNSELKYGAPPQFKKPAEDPRWMDLYERADDDLISFLSSVAARVPRTQFLVYSRGTDPNWLVPGFQEEWRKKIESRFPELKDRIKTMTISRGKNGSFRNEDTRKGLRRLVIDMLDLPEKPEPQKLK